MGRLPHCQDEDNGEGVLPAEEYCPLSKRLLSPSILHGGYLILKPKVFSFPAAHIHWFCIRGFSMSAAISTFALRLRLLLFIPWLRAAFLALPWFFR